MVAEAETRRNTTLAQLREWLTLIGAVVVVLGGLLGGVRLVVAPLYTEMQAMNGRLDRMETEIRAGREETQALREDMQGEFKAIRGAMQSEFKAIRGEMQNEFKAVRGEMQNEFKAVRGEMQNEFKAVRGEMSSEFKAVHADLADIRERLTRVETLLESETDQPVGADTPQ